MNTIELHDGQEYRRNKRVFVRSVFPVDTPCHFRMPHIPRNQSGILHSIFQAGLFIRSKRLPQIGSNLSITFDFCGRQINCQGRVLYQNTDSDEFNAEGFGVKFTKMFSDDHLSIKKAIEAFYQYI